MARPSSAAGQQLLQGLVGRAAAPDSVFSRMMRMMSRRFERLRGRAGLSSVQGSCSCHATRCGAQHHGGGWADCAAPQPRRAKWLPRVEAGLASKMSSWRKAPLRPTARHWANDLTPRPAPGMCVARSTAFRRPVRGFPTHVSRASSQPGTRRSRGAAGPRFAELEETIGELEQQVASWRQTKLSFSTVVRS